MGHAWHPWALLHHWRSSPVLTGRAGGTAARFRRPRYRNPGPGPGLAFHPRQLGVGPERGGADLRGWACPGALLSHRRWKSLSGAVENVRRAGLLGDLQLSEALLRKRGANNREGRNGVVPPLDVRGGGSYLSALIRNGCRLLSLAWPRRLALNSARFQADPERDARRAN